MVELLDLVHMQRRCPDIQQQRHWRTKNSYQAQGGLPRLALSKPWIDARAPQNESREGARERHLMNDKQELSCPPSISPWSLVSQ